MVMFSKLAEDIVLTLQLQFVNTVDPRLSKPHLSESSFIRTHKFYCESHYMVMNIINVVCYLNHLHVIQLSELFTYLNKFTRPVVTGVRISEDLLYMVFFWLGSTFLKRESYLKDYVQKVWTVIAQGSLPKIDETLTPYT